jgi:hypothetical protein
MPPAAPMQSYSCTVPGPTSNLTVLKYTLLLLSGPCRRLQCAALKHLHSRCMFPCQTLSLLT